MSWRRPANTEKSGGLSWRQGHGKDEAGKPKPDEAAVKKPEAKSALSALKKNTPQLQWRSIINKFTPEKFDKLCEQLLGTLPSASGGVAVSDGEFKQVLDDLLGIIFDSSSRQHQYTEMYTDLVQKLLDFVAAQRPEFDSKSCVWAKCQGIFKTMVLTPPDIPADLPEDEHMDRKVKHKEKMVGIVKFGGDLVSRGLVPCDGVMQWIQTLLSEKTQELYSGEAEDRGPEEQELHDKDAEQREVQLELLCAILAGMGASLSDKSTLSEDNRLVIEDVFCQLEQLSMDTKRLSLRIRCLIRDILDLRMAAWKEKEGKLKPGMLQSRNDELSNLREDAPEAKWFSPELLTILQEVEHHLEVTEDKDAKLERLKRLIKFYHLIQEQQLVVVANNSSMQRIVNLISESFENVGACVLEVGHSEAQRRKYVRGFETGDIAIMVMVSEVATRRDVELSKSPAVLVNFDFPMTLQLYLYRLYKRADSNTHVYTFFSPQHDARHTASLVVALEISNQKVPDALKKLKDQISSEGTAGSSSGGKGRDKGEGRIGSRKASKADEDEPPWKSRGGKGESRVSFAADSRDDRGGFDRDRSGSQADSHWEDRDGEGRGGGGGKGGNRTRAMTSASWRSDASDAVHHTASAPVGSGGSRQAGDDSGRDFRDRGESGTSRRDYRSRLDTTSEPQEDGTPGGDIWQRQDSWQRQDQQQSQFHHSRGTGRGAGGRRPFGGRGREGGSGDSDRHNDAPWFEDGQMDNRRASGARGSEQQRLDSGAATPGAADGRGDQRPRAATASAAGSSSSGAGAGDRGSLRLRKPDGGQSASDGGGGSQAGASSDARREPRSRRLSSGLDSFSDMAPNADKDRRFGSDKPRDAIHGSGSQQGARASGAGGFEHAGSDRHSGPPPGPRHRSSLGRGG